MTGGALVTSADPADQALAAGLAALRRASVVPGWHDAPPPFDRPPLGVELEMAAAAAALLAKATHPASAARLLGRRWPRYRLACPAIVRAVAERAREEARRHVA